jgi:hypothetical protein
MKMSRKGLQESFGARWLVHKENDIHIQYVEALKNESIQKL